MRVSPEALRGIIFLLYPNPKFCFLLTEYTFSRIFREGMGVTT